jgi:hypothetical protein
MPHIGPPPAPRQLVTTVKRPEASHGRIEDQQEALAVWRDVKLVDPGELKIAGEQYSRRFRLNALRALVNRRGHHLSVLAGEIEFLPVAAPFLISYAEPSEICQRPCGPMPRKACT